MSLSATGPAKDQFVLGLAALVCHGSGVEASADNLNAVVTASGNTVPTYWSPLYAQCIEKAGGVDKFFTKLGGGGAPAAAAAGGAAPVAVAVAEKPKEEEVDALEGGMDMFGGGGSDY